MRDVLLTLIYVVGFGTIQAQKIESFTRIDVQMSLTCVAFMTDNHVDHEVSHMWFDMLAIMFWFVTFVQVSSIEF